MDNKKRPFHFDDSHEMLISSLAESNINGRQLKTGKNKCP